MGERPDPARRSRVALLSSAWDHPHHERAFVARQMAGGVSRLASLDVLVPGPRARPRPDGAFDLLAVGEPSGAGATWPAPERACWPAVGRPALAIVDHASPDALALVEARLPGVAVAEIAGVAEGPQEGTGRGRRRTVVASLAVDPPGGGRCTSRSGEPVAATTQAGAGDGAGDDGGRAFSVGLHVAVDHEVARRPPPVPGTGYLLVLGDQVPGDQVPGDQVPGTAAEEPEGLAAWLIARFAARTVVVVENAVASVWRSRSRSAELPVTSRTGLWRLLAHADVTVDLSPGPLIARECVESLRFGVPVVVPAGSSARRLAAAGGGLWYRDVAELLGCVEALEDPAVRHGLGRQGREVADAGYGDPDRFVERVGAALRALSSGG